MSMAGNIHSIDDWRYNKHTIWGTNGNNGEKKNKNAAWEEWIESESLSFDISKKKKKN